MNQSAAPVANFAAFQSIAAPQQQQQNGFGAFSAAPQQQQQSNGFGAFQTSPGAAPSNSFAAFSGMSAQPAPAAAAQANNFGAFAGMSAQPAASNFTTQPAGAWASFSAAPSTASKPPAFPAASPMAVHS
jgi:hypothetical protein